MRNSASLMVVGSLLIGCQPGSTPPAPAITPVLEAVLRSGSPPLFAQRVVSTGGYEVLPSAATILRLANGYPGSGDRIRVTVTPSAGGAPQELAWVSRDDVPGKQSRDQTGYYEIAIDNFGYSLIVTPAPAERTGSGYSITVVNLSPGGSPAESAPLTVAVTARPTVAAPSSVFFDCGNDYDALDGRWHYNCKNSEGIVARDFALQGWLTGPGPNCLGGLCIEDFYYSFFPDPDFIDEYYGRGGAFAAIMGSAQVLENTVLPGNPTATSPPVTLADTRPDGTVRGITVSSFLHPQNRADDRPVGVVKGELNAWHPAAQGGLFSRHWVGRGAPPAGWMTPTVDPSDPNAAAWANTSWRVDPRRPDGGPDLVPGEYVRLFGPLWQDGAHEGPGGITPAAAPWSFFQPRLGAWLEIHPVDWVERVPPPPVRKTPFVISAIAYTTPTSEETATMAPDDPATDPSFRLHCRELVDGRYTDLSSVTRKDVVLSADKLEVTVAVARRTEPGPTPPPGEPRLDRIVPGRFKAVYVIWWQAGTPTGCESG